MTTLKVGIASVEQFRDYTMAIARGEHKRGRHEPKVWFSSIDSFAKVYGAEQSADLLRNTAVAVIGPVTGEAAEQLGIPVSIRPATYTIPALVESNRGTDDVARARLAASIGDEVLRCGRLPGHARL